MPRETRKKYPGRSDINAQFSAENIGKTLSAYKRVKAGDGDYSFGALTAKFYGLDKSENDVWKEDLKLYPKDVQDEIKRHVIHALTHVDHDGNEKPVPLKFEWKPGEKAVVLTYDPAAPSYKVEIFGLPSPAAAPFAQRREKKK